MGNELDIRNRIAKVKAVFKWTENSISRDSASQKRLNRQLSHGATITLDTLLLILNACPGLSADWLLLGKGDMIRGNCDLLAANNIRNPAREGNDSDITNRFLAVLEEKNHQIDRLIDLLSK